MGVVLHRICNTNEWTRAGTVCDHMTLFLFLSFLLFRRMGPKFGTIPKICSKKKKTVAWMILLSSASIANRAVYTVSGSAAKPFSTLRFSGYNVLTRIVLD